ncbi:RDD family protein [Pseudomonas putida]
MMESNTEYVYEVPSNLAGLGRRWIAHMTDIVITFALAATGFELALRLSPWIPAAAYLLWVGFLAAIAYVFLCDALPRGQSMGKRLFKIAVVSDISHADCRMMQSVVRNVSRFIPFEALPVFWGSRKRMGDIFAGTVVIRIA